jgi:hypothetical protein
MPLIQKKKKEKKEKDSSIQTEANKEMEECQRRVSWLCGNPAVA